MLILALLEDLCVGSAFPLISKIFEQRGAVCGADAAGVGRCPERVGLSGSMIVTLRQ